MTKIVSPSLSRRGFLKGGLATTAAALAGRVFTPEAAPAAAGEAPPSGHSTPEGLDTVPLRTEVNGKPVALEVHPDESAIDLVRERLNLTGCKVACGHGACGACSIHLDGVPVASCLLPATALEGRKVTTIEGLGDTLHPIQRAFMAEDALQCGYCTPGFVMASIAFFDRWRAEHGKTEPDREAVAAALAGHICRCGAYQGIYRAVQGACAGRFDEQDPAPVRQEARAKVTGTARYTVDVKLEHQLEGRILRSPHAHARVLKIDTGAAEALAGVAGVHVLTQVGNRVRFAGQEVVAVAAVDRHTADEALRLIRVEYEVLPAIVSASAARKADAVQVYPKGDRNPANASEGMVLPTRWEGNVRGPSSVGNHHAKRAERAVEAARQEGGSRLIDETWSAHVQCHTTLEPHSCVARWNGPDRLTVWLSTQAVTHMAEDIAERWGLKRRSVEVICEHAGGGFGAKARLGQEGAAAIELARKTGKPVRVALTRPEELTVGGLRPACDLQVQMVIDPQGGLEATQVKAYHDAGVAVGQNATIFFRLMYPESACTLQDYDVVTHAPPGEPFRAPGGPSAFWALEQTVDIAAERLGVDPVELRRRWDPDSARTPLYSWVASLPAWRDRSPKPQDTGRFRRGVGLATGCWMYFHEKGTQVEIQAGPDGIVASCGVQDMGNGARSVLSHVIAEVLGMAPESIDVRIGSSSQVRGPMSGGSRTTASIAPAAEDAANQLRDALVDVAARKWKLQDARAGKGGVDHARGSIPWSDVLKVTPELRVVGGRPKDQGGYFLPFSIAGLAIGKRLSGAAVVVELEVDTRLGKSRALRAWAGMNVGHVFVPMLAQSQVYGGIIQGISYALYEERRLDPVTGRLLTTGLEDYRIMGVGDCPEIDVHFHDAAWEKIQGGGVGLGELATISTAGAVGNAMFNATGWRPRAMPLRPDAVLKGVRI